MFHGAGPVYFMRYALIRSLCLMGGFIVGGCLPELAAYKDLIKLGLVVMLFAVYLRLEPSRNMFHVSQFAAAVFGIALAVLSWAGLTAADYPVLGQVAFFIAITPTATAAPVIVGLLGGNVTYTTAMFMVSNICVSLSLPVLIPVIMGTPAVGVVHDVVVRIGTVIVLPLVAAGTVRLFFGEKGKALGRGLAPVTFYLWISVVVLIAAQARAFLDAQEHIPWTLLGLVGGISLLLCIINFVAGYLFGLPKYPRECSQALGQKNNSYTVYLALTYATPIIALGPTIYVLWHNIWNAVQLYLCDCKSPVPRVPEEG